MEKLVHNQALTMKEIAEFTRIRKHILEKVLPRLKKRGWIERDEIWESEEITVIGQKGGFLKAYKAFWKARSAKDGSSESRRDYAREHVRKKLLPKRKIAYRILRYPYVVSDMKGITVPNRHKREWRSSANEVNQELSRYKNDWKEEKKKIESKIRRLTSKYFKPREEIRRERLQLDYDLAEHMKRKIKYVRFASDLS